MGLCPPGGHGPTGGFLRFFSVVRVPLSNFEKYEFLDNTTKLEISKTDIEKVNISKNSEICFPYIIFTPHNQVLKVRKDIYITISILRSLV